ncbi:hypothetical protein SS50377_27748 [Spironucleus salmonicida]|uniref:Uncharacterized protein n=1 Tax=Spironucleus salmonicida TaxID=348837 RepID=A0A9P8RUM6_9EUKA|nr:hypothetical protein SS50377_27748 [Spironucleus salmonicida]
MMPAQSWQHPLRNGHPQRLVGAVWSNCTIELKVWSAHKFANFDFVRAAQWAGPCSLPPRCYYAAIQGWGRNNRVPIWGQNHTRRVCLAGEIKSTIILEKQQYLVEYMRSTMLYLRFAIVDPIESNMYKSSQLTTKIFLYSYFNSQLFFYQQAIFNTVQINLFKYSSNKQFYHLAFSNFYSYKVIQGTGLKVIELCKVILLSNYYKILLAKFCQQTLHIQELGKDK